MALNSIEIGLIACLFPEARIIFALRDPRDVCLSCFQQTFRP
ncbi:sulfotransferase, partial [Haloferula sp.]